MTYKDLDNNIIIKIGLLLFATIGCVGGGTWTIAHSQSKQDDKISINRSNIKQNRYDIGSLQSLSRFNRSLLIRMARNVGVPDHEIQKLQEKQDQGD